MFIYEEMKVFNKDEEIFELVYNCALRDATLRTAYKGEKSWIENDSCVKEILKKYVKKLLNGEFKCQTEYDDYFKDTAIKICNRVNRIEKVKDSNSDDDNKFTFGNAQKLINMTAKYYYISCCTNSAKRENFKYCHCPVDCLLLEKVWKFIRTNKELEEKIKTTWRNNTKRDYFLKSWGKEDWEKEGEFPERYSIFQEAVSELSKEIEYGDTKEKGIYPIEFDFMVWRIAKAEEYK